jgi:MinD-like ATPase involved in chromosome partitioning or flagellar assembly
MIKEKSKKISIFGAPFSGKTTFAVKLAMSLVNRKKDVIILSSDYFTPTSAFFSNSDMNKNLGNIIKEEAVNRERIIENLIPIYKKGKVALLSYALFENAGLFREISKKDIDYIFEILLEITDFLIIDTMSIFYADKISSYALKNSDINIGIYNSSLKDYINYISNKELINKSINGKKIYILSKVKNKAEEKECKKLYERVDFSLPFVEELGEQFERKALLEKMTGKKTKEYKLEINKIKEVIHG